MTGVREHVGLDRFTTLGTGGPARFLSEPSSLDELARVLEWAEEESVAITAIGLGSNMLVADDGFTGLAIRLRGELAAVEVENGGLRAGGGAPLAVCLHRARAAGLGGLEFTCAIPGTVGGGVWMNAGAYGGDIARVLRRAYVVAGGDAGWQSPAELGLEYRRSALRHGQVVAFAEFELGSRPEAEIRAAVADMQAARKAAQPTNKRTFGSVFKNPDHELTAGRMLDACGLRGFVSGGAQISPKHANFIENAGGARTSDALALIVEARRRAFEEYGVVLETEVQMIGDIQVPPVDKESSATSPGARS